MFFQQNLSLQGEFSYQVYNERGELKQSNSGIKNFITSTGLTYPATYAFADCFRFVSLGNGTTRNTLSGNFGGTTGLSQPMSQFSYIGSRTSYGDTTTSQYVNPACGFTENLGLVTLSRGWKIPSNADTFDADYTFNEIMLSPGKPTGIARLCGCAGSDTGNGGVDASLIADYYDSLSGPSICEAHYAFTRIVLDQPITVNIRDYLVVSYNLNVAYDTGVNLFKKNISNTFSTNWSPAITGISNIVHHGIKLINNGETDVSNFRNQIRTNFSNYNWSVEYGESYIPLWGAPLEPSCLASNLLAYLSTDNVQFLVNQISGGPFDAALWKPYNSTGFTRSSGLLSAVANPSNTNVNSYYNIRTNLNGPIYPAQSGAEGIGSPLSDINYIFHSFSNKTNKVLLFTPSGRSRSMLYPFVFTNLNANNWANGTSPTPSVRSMVLNYSDSNAVSNQVMYPFLDLLFTGIGGESLPVLSPTTFAYSPPNSDYFFLGGGGDLTLSFTLSWSSPCSSSVDGC